MMTWPEVKAALAAGKTTALFYTGGTEQRGPQNVNGGHTLMGARPSKAIALQARQRDRDAGAALHAEQRQRRPARHHRPDAGDPRRRSSSAITEQAITTGFKNVDHHGRPRRRPAGDVRRGREEARRQVRARRASTSTSATRSTPRRRATSTSGWSEHGYPRSSHAGIPDTSTMLYLGGDKGWVRKELIPTAEGDPVPPPGARGQGRGTRRSERAAAQEQRHHRRRAPLDRGARQAWRSTSRSTTR